MAIERAEGVVLRVLPVTETSLVVTWLTREYGKIKTLAKGARRPKSPLRGKLDLFYEAEILFWRSSRSELHVLHDCFLENPHRKLRASLMSLTAASYACELVDAVTAVEDRPGQLYDLLAQVLGLLEQSAGVVPVVWFELQVLAAAGWRPDFTGATGVGKVLQSLAAASVTGMQRVRLSAAQIREAQDLLERFRGDHLGRVLQSHRLLSTKIQH
ncbi:MAG: DNA repair protein RecO [Verrucomicrobiae bacterium]|nr:DNA repair protein RecO [Verrucomicrobiae bacterium]